MQKVTSIFPSWDKTKSGSKKGFDKAYAQFDKLGAPINRWTNKIGSEAFWPTTLDLESDKAARILRSFCKDGFYTDDDRPASLHQPNAKSKQRVVKKIPSQVIRNAVGLAIFTTMRTGLWVSGAGGSGIIVARTPDGSWSPPSGIMLHTAGLGFLVGVDIYDCVLVINNRNALESFTRIRCTVGGEISAVAGPVGVGGVVENDGKWKQANRPVFTYLKSRGFYAGVQLDGTVLIERTDENERFYGQRISASDILAGKARHPPYEVKMLMETLKAAEGSGNVDQSLMTQLDHRPVPGDVELSTPTTDDGPIFGIPEADDPDPFGAQALQKLGLEIREAGTHSRAPSSTFEFNPSPTSPIYAKFHRRGLSIETTSSRGGNDRASFMSHRTRGSINSIDRSTQTELPSINGAVATSPVMMDDGRFGDRSPRSEPGEVDYTQVDLGPYSSFTPRRASPDLDGATMTDSPRLPSQTQAQQHGPLHDPDHASDDGSDDDEEEPVVLEASSAQATMLMPSAFKPRVGVVKIPARGPPPPLPPRSSARRPGSDTSHMTRSMSPVSPLSATHEGFEAVDLHGVDISARTSLDHSNANGSVVGNRSSLTRSRGHGSFGSMNRELNGLGIHSVTEGSAMIDEQADIGALRLEPIISKGADSVTEGGSVASMDESLVADKMGSHDEVDAKGARPDVAVAADDAPSGRDGDEDATRDRSATIVAKDAPADVLALTTGECRTDANSIDNTATTDAASTSAAQPTTNPAITTAMPVEPATADTITNRDDKDDKDDFHSLSPSPGETIPVR